MRRENLFANEGNNYDYSFSLPESTSGETISARMLSTTGSGTGVSVGSVSGDTANTELTVQLGIKDLAPDDYYLELWADYGGADQRLVIPSPNVQQVIKIGDRFGVSN